MISCAVTLQNTGSFICSLYIFAADFTAQPGGLQKDENISPVRPNPIYYIREYENISENMYLLQDPILQEVCLDRPFGGQSCHNFVQELVVQQ